jgi:hypothetical protein
MAVVVTNFNNEMVMQIASCIALASAGVGDLFARDQKQSEIENQTEKPKA